MKLNGLLTMIGVPAWQVALVGGLLCLSAPLTVGRRIDLGLFDDTCFGLMALIFFLLMRQWPASVSGVTTAVVMPEAAQPSPFERMTVSVTNRATSVKEAVVNFAKANDLVPLEKDGTYYFQCTKTRKMYYAQIAPVD